MNYSLIRPCDIANGPGVRVSLFVSGCTHHCIGCFQPETWDFNYGKKFTDETIWEILRLLEPNYIDGLSILGGEPLDQQNMDDVWALLDVVRRMGPPEKTVWLYTGSTLEFLNARPYKHGPHRSPHIVYKPAVCSSPVFLFITYARHYGNFLFSYIFLRMITSRLPVSYALKFYAPYGTPELG